MTNPRQFNYASAEAARKILKRHAKRTALPFPPSFPREIISAVGVADVEMPTSTTPASVGHTSHAQIPLPRRRGSLPQFLIQAIGDVVLPIVPHIDDYSCVICTSIAFKPIRLSCGHLFCVRQVNAMGDCEVD